MMNITKRTLQTYKDKGLLPFSKLNRKNYYKLSDVQALLEAGQPYNTNGNGHTEQFRLYYTSTSAVSQSFEVWISDSFGNEKQLNFQFNSSD